MDDTEEPTKDATPADTTSTRPPRPRWIIGLLTVLVVGLVASNVFLWTQVRDTRDRLDTTTADVSNLDETVQSIEPASDLDCSSGYFNPPICDRLDEMQSAIDEADDSGTVMDLADCVNTYMDVVANARGGAYRYQRC